jgi:acyl-CoA synthetase (AMP-forming)/AMP-acid ligase II
VTCEAPGAGGEAGAAGAPVAGVQVRIAAADPDGIGEIRVRGRVVMEGYLGDAAATAAAMPDGWLRTGDLGRLTDDGVLHVAGRRSDVIVTGGENVHPSEVEAVLLAHPAVAEAAAYGVADDVWGERIEAKVVFRGPPVDGAVLAAWCGTQLARFKIPKAFHPVGALARTASGKVLRAAR